MTSNQDSEAIFHGSAEIIGRCFPEVALRLLELHVPDTDGRCRACRCGNRSAPLAPCGLRVLAELALDHQHRPPGSAARGGAGATCEIPVQR